MSRAVLIVDANSRIKPAERPLRMRFIAQESGSGGLISALPEDECGDPRVSRGRGQSTLPASPSYPPLWGRRAGGRRHQQTGAEDRGRRVWAWSQTGTRRRRTGDSAGRGAERRRTPSRMHVHVRPRLRPGRQEAVIKLLLLLLPAQSPPQPFRRRPHSHARVPAQLPTRTPPRGEDPHSEGLSV